MNFLTEFREGLAISWSAILANKLRSVLTTLGIIIVTHEEDIARQARRILRIRDGLIASDEKPVK